MPEDQLREVMDAVRSRLQAELDAQLRSLTDSQAKALDEARRAAERDAEQRWASTLEASRTEWTARMQSEIAAARSEAERTAVAESMRARVEAEQAVADARRERELAVAAERVRLESALDAERQRADQLLAQGIADARARGDAALAAERQTSERALAEARAVFDAERERAASALEAATPAPSADASALLEAVLALDSATTLSDLLAAVLRAAAAAAPRAALFVVTGTELMEWPVPGVDEVHAGPIRADGREAGFLADVLRRNETIWTSAEADARPAPAFAALPPGRIALAVPFVLDGRPVAILYADERAAGDAPAVWRETVQIIGRHGAACVAYLTAVRAAQAMRIMSGEPATDASAAMSEDDQGARRYARLLVSEIKLYNESAVSMGRDRRDLRQRLKEEIDRARRLYDERVSPSVAGRDTFFHQELVQTLAGGDASLLG